jgi:stage II sporulation protein M
MLFALTSVIPQNLVLIPTLIICSVSSIAFGLHLLKNRFLRQHLSIPVSFAKFLATAFSLSILLIIVSLYEALLSPWLMKWVTPMLIS